MPQSRSQEKAGQELDMISTVVSVIPETVSMVVASLVELPDALLSGVVVLASVVAVTVECALLLAAKLY